MMMDFVMKKVMWISLQQRLAFHVSGDEAVQENWDGAALLNAQGVVVQLMLVYPPHHKTSSAYNFISLKYNK